MSNHHIESLQPLIDSTTLAIEQHGHDNAKSIINALTPSFQALLKDPSWLPTAYRQPHPDSYRQYLLYLDPLERFSIVSFVWNGGQKTPIHNHQVWGAIGILEGAELATSYTITPGGSLQAVGQPLRLSAGAIDWFSPDSLEGDIHAVMNALDDEVSISIHIYGGNIGKIQRFTYQLDGRKTEFISGYSLTD